MSQHEYKLFGVEQPFDDDAGNNWLYLTKEFNKYYQRIYLLNSGQLALADYVNYRCGRLPEDVANGKLVGKGVMHNFLRQLGYFGSITEALNHPLLLKSKLIDMSQVLIKRSSDTGYYELIQREELEAIFLAAKV
jgi:hypothetical protein